MFAIKTSSIPAAYSFSKIIILSVHDAVVNCCGDDCQNLLIISLGKRGKTANGS